MSSRMVRYPPKRSGVGDAAAHDSGADDGDGAYLRHATRPWAPVAARIGDEIGIGLAHVFGQTLLFVVGEEMQASTDTTERCRDVVHVIHHAD